MTPIAIPAEERRALVRGFWLTVAFAAAAPWILLAASFEHPELVVVAALVAAAAALMPIANSGFAWRVYGAWNRRLVYPFSRLATRWTLAVCFWVIRAASRVGRSRMAMASPSVDGTLWTARRSLEPTEYQHLFVTKSGSTGAWLSDYAAWACRTGNQWAIALVPFLVLLRCLPREEERVVENIYTLF